MNDMPPSTSAMIARIQVLEEELAHSRLSLRDTFALAALPGVISSAIGGSIKEDTEAAYMYADYMLEARDANR